MYVQRSRSFAFFLNRGNCTVGPGRFPVLEPCQFFSAVTAPAIPPAYASLEHSAHHGATSPLTWFHRFRSAHPDHTSRS